MREGRAVVEYEGAHRTALWVPDESGRLRGREYFVARAARDRARLQAVIELECDLPQGIRDSTKFRLEEDGIWVFKRYQDRLFCYFDGRTVCITHGIRKKQDKLPAKELKIAKRIREHNLKRGE